MIGHNQKRVFITYSRKEITPIKDLGKKFNIVTSYLSYFPRRGRKLALAVRVGAKYIISGVIMYSLNVIFLLLG